MGYLIVIQRPIWRVRKPFEPQFSPLVGETIKLHPVFFLGNDSILCNVMLEFGPRQQSLVRIKQRENGWSIESVGSNIPIEYDERPIHPFHSRDLHPGKAFFVGGHGFLFRSTPFDSNWLSTSVIDLARSFSHDRDRGRLPILADALEEAGCCEGDILQCCRSATRRDTWIIDWIMVEAKRYQPPRLRAA
jgi:hypothetical protein